MQDDTNDLEGFARHMAARRSLKARIDKSRGHLVAILPALLHWCSERSGPDPITGQPYFELKTLPDLRDTETRDIRAVSIGTWNGRELAICVNEQGGGILVGEEFFESIVMEDPADVTTITFVPFARSRSRPGTARISPSASMSKAAAFW